VNLKLHSKTSYIIKINFSDLSFVKIRIGGTDFTTRAGHLLTVGWSAAWRKGYFYLNRGAGLSPEEGAGNS